MAFLIRRDGKKQRAHIWTGDDTACRMWSTGGLKQDRFEVCDNPRDREICFMCRMVEIREQLTPHGL